MWDDDCAMAPKQSSASQIERRRAERLSCNGDMICRLIEPVKYRSNQVGIRDISLSGICLLLPAQFDTGAELTIELINRQLRFMYRLSIRVQHNGIQLPNESWLHGCAFTKALPKQVLEAFTE